MRLNQKQRAGRKGGRVTSKRHSSEHFQNIGRTGGVTCRTLYGSGLYSAIRTGKKKS